jgi:tetratricopeptide (TPR) repeat protein
MKTYDLEEKPSLSPITSYQWIVQCIGSGKYSDALQQLGAIDKKTLLSSHALLNAYGVALRSTGKAEEAVQMYQLALKLDVSQGGTWSNLGNALKDSNYPNASISAHRRALDLSAAPDSKLWHNYGIALAIAGNHADAIIALEKAVQIDPQKKGLRWDLARSQLAIKDYRRGFENYQYRWDTEEAPPRRVFGVEWSGTRLLNEPLFVYAEQGFGDYIQCSRYLPLLQKKAANLVVEVKPELRALMEHSFPAIRFVDYVEERLEVKEGFIASLLDAPRFFPEEPLDGHAYLQPQPASYAFTDTLANKLADSKSLNIGIIWSGSVTFKRNQFRAAKVDWFYKQCALPGVNLFSLQMGPRANDLASLPLQLISAELTPHIKNFNDTANILRELDLVIMTCSSTAHLCGALNIPCWVLLDSSPHWLWGQQQSKSDWYDSIRLFHQKSPGDWRSVFDQVGSELMSMSKQNND